MKSKRLTARTARILGAAFAFWFSVAGAQAGEKVILSFSSTNTIKGAIPLSGMVSDAAGNLYGTTEIGGTGGPQGAGGCGTVFEISPTSGGKWRETLLFSFLGCDIFPLGTMVLDKEGNLYGVANYPFNEKGAIFQLSKGADGAWSEKIIHSFGFDVGGPSSDLTIDSAGNLYGTTGGGSTNHGEVFELSPQADGSWKEGVIYTFPAPSGLANPNAGVVFDSHGNLYGSASVGSDGGLGAVYELSPQANGQWIASVILNGGNPTSRLTFDSTGNLYGTSNQTGQVFELSPTTGGRWAETVLYTFTGNIDGSYPVGALVIDASGNVYGATTYGGLGCSQYLCGLVYRLSPKSGGGWKETILHTFESAEDGSEPQEGLLLDSAGNLYGTTSGGGGRYGYGTVYEITP